MSGVSHPVPQYGDPHPSAPPISARPHGQPPGWLGLVLAVPFLGGWLVWLVLPTLRTATMSFERINMLASTSEPAGGANYAALSDAGFWSAFAHTASLLVAPVLVTAVLAPALAFALHRAGPRLRLAGRLLLCLPLAGLAPAVVVTGWAATLNPSGGALGGILSLADVARAPATMRLVTALSAVGLICGIGVTAYLAALYRGDEDGRPARTVPRSAVVVLVVLVLGVVAVGLQSFTLPFGLTHGGPEHSTTTVELLQYTESFTTERMGIGAATATLVLVMVLVLGTGAGLVLVLSGTEIDLAPRRPAELRGAVERPKGQLLGALAVAVLAVVALVDLLPRLSALGGVGPSTPSGGAADMLLYTILPTLLVVVAQVTTAYLAGLGIGALRPLGRHSGWLLLPFCPWLFVTVGPLSLAIFESARSSGQVNTLVGLVSPILVSVPALVVFTMFSAGAARRWRAAQATGGGGSFPAAVVRPAVPLILLVAVVAALVRSTDVLWPLLITQGRHTTGSALLLTMQSQYAATHPTLGALVAATPFGLLALLAFAAFLAFYGDRLAIRVHRAATR